MLNEQKDFLGDKEQCSRKGKKESSKSPIYVSII